MTAVVYCFFTWLCCGGVYDSYCMLYCSHGGVYDSYCMLYCFHGCVVVVFMTAFMYCTVHMAAFWWRL